MPFAIVDVFGERSLTGNPLAVVDLTGDGVAVDDGWLAAVAREFNQAETTFVLPGAGAADRVLRSFTMGGVEVFGAGHNALGAWWWLIDSGRVTARPELVQRLGGHDLVVEVGADGWLAMRQRVPRFGAVADAAVVAAALGLNAGDLRDRPAPRVVDTGTGHLMVLAPGRDVPARAVPDAARLAPVTAGLGGQGVYLAWADPAAPVAHARFFSPGVGLAEDSATGTAAGPLAAHLRDTGLLAPGTGLTVYQGEAMGRPSTLRVTLREDGAPVLAGRGFVTAEGMLRVG